MLIKVVAPRTISGTMQNDEVMAWEMEYEAFGSIIKPLDRDIIRSYASASGLSSSRVESMWYQRINRMELSKNDTRKLSFSL